MRLLNVVECQFNHARKHLLLHEFVALVTNVKKNSHVNFNSKSSMKALMKQLSLASEAYNIKGLGVCSDNDLCLKLNFVVYPPN